jgi:hypothetical protein
MVDASLCSPKRRFWKDEQMMKSGFSIEFSAIRSPNRVLTTLIRISSFVPPSEIYSHQTKILDG